MGEQSTQSLILRATSILRLGIIPSDSLTSSKSNSELVYSLRNVLQNSLTHDCASPTCQWHPSTSQAPDSPVCYIPARDQSDAPDLSDTPRDQLDVTVKLFFLDKDQPASESRQTAEAALKEFHLATGLSDVDLLIMQSPGVHYEAAPGTAAEEQSLVANEVQRYNDISALSSIGSLGIAEFSLPRLREFFASDLKRKPIVNQVNLKDCCSVNSALTDFINKHDMQLLVHSDLSNLLPDSTFLSLLDSFKQQLPPGLKHSYPGMTPRWVLKYTVLYKHRSVVADKGYIVCASV